MIKPKTIFFLLSLAAFDPFLQAQCPNGTIVTVINNAGTNTNGSLAWALDCLDNAGSSLTTVQFNINGATVIQPSAAASLGVNKAGATIEGGNLGAGGSIIIDGGSPVGAPTNGLSVFSSNVVVQDLIIQNFNGSGASSGINVIGNGATVQRNTLTGNRIGIVTGSSVFSFSFTDNTIGESGDGNIQGGVAINGAPSSGIITDNEIADNGGPGISITGGTVLISKNSTYCNTSSGITRPSPPIPPNISLANTQMISGTAAANTAIEVFIFSTAGCAGSPVQGKTYLGSSTTLATGVWTLPLSLGAVNAGDMVTATSTENANNTSVFSAPATVVDCSNFVASIDQVDVTCNGDSDGTATAIPTGSVFSYVWEHGPTTSSVSNLSGGIYTVTITNTIGCTASQSAFIMEPPVLSLTILPNDISCFGENDGAATAFPDGGTPGYTFAWSNGETTAMATNLLPGTYTVTVTDLQNCLDALATVIDQPAALNLTIVPSHVSCFAGNNGSAQAMAGGGTPGYAYLWSNGQMAPNATGLVSGTYTVTISDLNSCTAARNTIITQAPELILNVSFTGETMAGANDGTASASTSGGTPDYSYQWSTGADTEKIVGLAPGLYTVTITDLQGCTKTGTVTVTLGGGSGGCTAQPVYAVLAPAQVCGNTAFTLEADDLYPSPVVQYVWQLPNGDSVITTQPSLTITANSSAYSGAYFVLRDSAGCRSIAVGGAPVMVLTVDNVSAGNDVVLCSPAVTQLNATIPSSGLGSWVSLGAATVANPSQNQTTANNLQAGSNAFVWKVALSTCVQAATDTVILFLEKKPTLSDDHYTLQYAFDIAVMEVLLNDDLSGLTDTLLVQVSTPSSGQLELLTESRRFRYTVDENFRGIVTFQYAICNPASVCNIPCDTATVTIDVQNLPTVPTGLVVGDPGLNGALNIRGINGFTRVEITITDRWGDLVFREMDYDNNNAWAGDYKRSGQYLPGGAYYYFLKAFDGKEQVGATQTGVIHLFDK